jgi:myosin-light-chain kinase
MGENDNDTYANINRANYDFDDEAFTDISDEAKDFISKLLIKDKEYEKFQNSIKDFFFFF